MQSLLEDPLRARRSPCSRIWLSAIAAFLVALVPSAARAQQPLWNPENLKLPADTAPAANAAPPPAEPEETAAPNMPIAPSMGSWERPPICWTQGIGMYFRSGPTIPLGSDPFQSRHDAGIAIEAGMRQRIAGGPYDFVFLDVGGSFLSARGQRTNVTPGFVQNSLTNQRIDLNDFYNSTLLNVRRGAADLALGGYFHPFRLLGIYRDAVRTMLRGGGRWGTIRGLFHDTVTPDLAAAISSLQTPGAAVSVHSLYNKSDTFEGLFISGGIDVIVRRPNPRMSNGPMLTFGVEAEYSHDWINFKHFSRTPLDVVAIMASGSLIF